MVLRGLLIIVTTAFTLIQCSILTIQVSIILIMSIGSKLNNVPFSIARIFFSQPSSSNVVAVRFGKITARPGALILVCSCFQLHHAPLHSDPEPYVTLGEELQPDKLFENMM